MELRCAEPQGTHICA